MLGHCGRSILIALFFLAQPSATLHAQVSAPQVIQPGALAEIQRTIIQTIGAQADTVELAVNGNIVTIAHQQQLELIHSRRARQ